MMTRRARGDGLAFFNPLTRKPDHPGPANDNVTARGPLAPRRKPASLNPRDQRPAPSSSGGGGKSGGGGPGILDKLWKAIGGDVGAAALDTAAAVIAGPGGAPPPGPPPPTWSTSSPAFETAKAAALVVGALLVVSSIAGRS